MAATKYRVVIRSATVYEVVAESRGEAGDLALKSYNADPDRARTGVVEISEADAAANLVASYDLSKAPVGRGC